jgi:hypothetical protein
LTERIVNKRLRARQSSQEGQEGHALPRPAACPAWNPRGCRAPTLRRLLSVACCPPSFACGSRLRVARYGGRSKVGGQVACLPGVAAPPRSRVARCPFPFPIHLSITRGAPVARPSILTARRRVCARKSVTWTLSRIRKSMVPEEIENPGKSKTPFLCATLMRAQTRCFPWQGMTNDHRPAIGQGRAHHGGAQGPSLSPCSAAQDRHRLIGQPKTGRLPGPGLLFPHRAICPPGRRNLWCR